MSDLTQFLQKFKQGTGIYEFGTEFFAENSVPMERYVSASHYAEAYELFLLTIHRKVPLPMDFLLNA